MNKRFLVIGMGRFGASLAESLGQQGCEVIAADQNMANVEAVQEKVAHAVELDATDAEALRAIEAASCRVAIVAIGGDFEASVLSVAALKEVGVRYVVARAKNQREGQILRAVGASEILEIETDTGRRFALDLASDKTRGAPKSS